MKANEGPVGYRKYLVDTYEFQAKYPSARPTTILMTLEQWNSMINAVRKSSQTYTFGTDSSWTSGGTSTSSNVYTTFSTQPITVTSTTSTYGGNTQYFVNYNSAYSGFDNNKYKRFNTGKMDD